MLSKSDGEEIGHFKKWWGYVFSVNDTYCMYKRLMIDISVWCISWHGFGAKFKKNVFRFLGDGFFFYC